MFSFESPHREDSDEYTQYTIFNALMGFFPRDSRMSSDSRGKRYISVQATEGLL